MTGAGDERLEPLGARHAAFRRPRRFDRMDVIVIGARMPRVARHHPFQGGDDLFGAWFGLAIKRIELPGPQVHHALGVERGGIEIVRKALRDLAHRRRVGCFTRWLLTIVRRRHVALGKRIDEGPFDVTAGGSSRLRVGQMVVRLLQPVWRRRVVVVGTERQRHPPMRHRCFRIERGGAFERAKRLFMIEAVQQGQAFVEKLLRLGIAGRDGSLILTKISKQRRACNGSAVPTMARRVRCGGVARPPGGGLPVTTGHGDSDEDEQRHQQSHEGPLLSQLRVTSDKFKVRESVPRCSPCAPLSRGATERAGTARFLRPESNSMRLDARPAPRVSAIRTPC